MSALPPGVGARIRGAITPECGNLSKSIKMASLVSLAFIFICLIILIAAIAFNYLKKVGNSFTEEKKRDIINGMLYGAAAIALISTLASVWQYSVAGKTVKSCLE